MASPQVSVRSLPRTSDSTAFRRFESGDGNPGNHFGGNSERGVNWPESLPEKEGFLRETSDGQRPFKATERIELSRLSGG